MPREVYPASNDKADSGKRHLRSKNRGRSAAPTSYIFDFDHPFNNFDYEKPLAVRLIPETRNSIQKVPSSKVHQSPSVSPSSLSPSSPGESSTSTVQTPTSPLQTHQQEPGATAATSPPRRVSQRVEFELYSYAGVNTGRRHAPDALLDAAFEPFHKHMARVEKRARQVERERSVSEHSRFKQIKQDLTGSLWQAVLPTVTKINNIKDKAEMEVKRKKTVEEIDFFMARYTRYKFMEKKMLQSIIEIEEPEYGAAVRGAKRSKTSSTGKKKTPRAVINANNSERLTGTVGVFHNTYDANEPGVDYLSSGDEDDGGKWEWVYDGKGTGVRSIQR